MPRSRMLSARDGPGPTSPQPLASLGRPCIRSTSSVWCSRGSTSGDAMAELALPRELRAIGRRAIDEAVARRAGTVEAEHVLLAILAQPDAPASRALAGVGLDHRTL